MIDLLSNRTRINLYRTFSTFHDDIAEYINKKQTSYVGDDIVEKWICNSF